MFSDHYENITITLATLWMFCLAQSWFWVYIGSRQLDALVADKAEILNTFFEFSNPEWRTQFCARLIDSKPPDSEEEEREIHERNFSMLKERFTLFFLLTFSGFLVFLYLSIRKHFGSGSAGSEARNAFLVGLALVLLSFATEIVIFYFLIQPYVVIGDIELFEKILYP